jgi:hypothetical protein
MRIRISRTLIVELVVLVAALGSAGSAMAAAGPVYTVNTNRDGNLFPSNSTVCATASDSSAQGKCTLRAAIQAAGNQEGVTTTIKVPADTYTLSQAADNCTGTCPAVSLFANASGPIDIVGVGASSTIVDANFQARAFVIESGVVSISGLTIEHGGPGSQLQDAPTLTSGIAVRCPSPNISEYDGGGILQMAGNLTLDADTVTDNLAAGDGGGVDNNGPGALTVKKTTVSHNLACTYNSGVGNARGGGIATYDGGPLTIIDSVISDNHAAGGGDGGGVAETESAATTKITDTTIFGNIAANGGGIASEGGGTFTLFGDLLTHNKATLDGQPNYGQGEGGGFLGFDTDTIINTTITGNSAVGDGGGMFTYGNFAGLQTLSFSTVVLNSSPNGGVGNLGLAVPEGTRQFPGKQASPTSGYALDDDIVAQGNNSASNCEGRYGLNQFFADDGHNLFNDTSDKGAQCSSAAGDHDVIVSNPKLAKLAANGGPTKTIALLPSSPAINGASRKACTSETKDAHGKTVDQRNFPRFEAPHCDIGAFENNPDLVLGGSVQKSPILVGQQDTVIQTIQDGAFYQADHTTFTDPGAGYKIDSASSAQGSCTHTATTVTCHLGTVALRGKKPPKVKIVLTGLTPGTITLHGKVTTSGYDPTPANNKDTVKIKVKAAPKPPPPTVSVASLGAACYRESSTIAIPVKATASAGIRTLTIKVAGRTVKTYTFTSHAPQHKSVTVHVHASTLTPGRSYTVSAKVTDTLARSASASRPLKICKRPHHHGFTG